jgi:hypothetical protein
MAKIVKGILILVISNIIMKILSFIFNDTETLVRSFMSVCFTALAIYSAYTFGKFIVHVKAVDKKNKVNLEEMRLLRKKIKTLDKQLNSKRIRRRKK